MNSPPIALKDRWPERYVDGRPAPLASASESFRPLLFHLGHPNQEAALDELLARGQVSYIHDTLLAQLEELTETRSPERKIARQELAEVSKARAGSNPDAYGVWVFYPWSARLVHILPEEEYEELRTSRNRNKITREEQTRLARLRIGVVGLSVGLATAVTLALEGVGGCFRLADFDKLSLSNMNRLRAGVHEIGINKTIVAARHIWEINPYAKIELFVQGVFDDCLDAFFSRDEPLDLLFEECDDLKMKFRLREQARVRGIPVLMETSDRGMIDVERFDREPSRPLFHSLVGPMDADRLGGMSTYEKVPIVLGIIGAKTMSRRMAASLVDIDATIKTWPQLASAVALGGAINTDTARRIALGKVNESGRFYVDLDALIADKVQAKQSTEPDDASTSRATLSRSTESAADDHGERLAQPISVASQLPVDHEVLRRLVALATTAPSGGNCQPWRFACSNGVLRCWHDEVRSRSFLDYQNQATYAAFGALSENLRLSAATLGVGVNLKRLPDPSMPLLMCDAVLGGPPETLNEEDATLARQVELRVTNRRLGQRVSLSPKVTLALQDVAARAGARLLLISSPDALEALSAVLGAGDRIRLMSPIMHSEMMSEIRWSKEEAAERRDGLELASLELSPTDEAAVRLISDWSVMAALREVNGGQGLATLARKSIDAASAVALLTVARSGNDAQERAHAFFRGGIAFQRVWLLATGMGLAMQPMTALPYMFARLEDDGAPGFDDDEKRALAHLRLRYRTILGLADPVHEVLLFRISVAGPPTVRSLRRHVDDILSIGT